MVTGLALGLVGLLTGGALGAVAGHRAAHVGGSARGGMNGMAVGETIHFGLMSEVVGGRNVELVSASIGATAGCRASVLLVDNAGDGFGFVGTSFNLAHDGFHVVTPFRGSLLRERRDLVVAITSLKVGRCTAGPVRLTYRSHWRTVTTTLPVDLYAVTTMTRRPAETAGCPAASPPASSAPRPAGGQPSRATVVPLCRK
ncbi:MAG: hypothetical protein QOG53_522 [Frankiales bacterium]|nr:hypothetical protein [Frankiales bacterium]